LEKNIRDLPRVQRLEAVADSIGPEVIVEIWWTTHEGRDMLVDRLHSMLCGDRPVLVERPPTPPSTEENERDETEEDYIDDELAADMELLDDEEEESNLLLGLWNNGEEAAVSSEENIIIAYPLSSPSASTRKKKSVRAKYHREQTEARVKQIIAKLPQATEPTLVIIEMPNYRKPKQRRQYGLRDPRRALRLGLAHTKRVTKFTLPANYSFPKNMLVAAIWMVRLTQKRGFLRVHFPMVVLFHTAHRQVRAWFLMARAPGLSIRRC
jgi:hypothetical protein